MGIYLPDERNICLLPAVHAGLAAFMNNVK